MTAHKKWLALILNATLAVLAAASLVRVFTKSEGSFDFHCYYYAGNLIWQGSDPYRAFLEHKEVDLPIAYLDGVTVAEGKIDPFRARCVAGNTAPMVFLLSPLARFSWDPASTIWRVLNTLLALAVGWILLKILGRKIATLEGMALLLLILVQVPTREVLELGQTSLLVSFCVFASLFLSYGDRTPWRAAASGLLLGLALSKFLLAFPLLLLFLYRRRFLEVAVALCLQAAGIWGIALLGTGVPSVIEEYWRIFTMHAGPGAQDGVYLTAGLLKGWQPYSYYILAAGSLALGALLLRWHRRQSERNGESLQTDLVLLTVLMLWNLLVFYHRRYDYVGAGSFFAVVLFLSSPHFRPAMRAARERMAAYCMAAAIAAFWSLPFYRALSKAVYRGLFNVCTLAALGLSIWVLFRLKSVPNEAFNPDYEFGDLT
jgi:hypothetical protein